MDCVSSAVLLVAEGPTYLRQKIGISGRGQDLLFLEHIPLVVRDTMLSVLPRHAIIKAYAMISSSPSLLVANALLAFAIEEGEAAVDCNEEIVGNMVVFVSISGCFSESIVTRATQ